MGRWLRCRCMKMTHLSPRYVWNFMCREGRRDADIALSLGRAQIRVWLFQRLRVLANTHGESLMGRRRQILSPSIHGKRVAISSLNKTMIASERIQLSLP